MKDPINMSEVATRWLDFCGEYIFGLKGPEYVHLNLAVVGASAHYNDLRQKHIVETNGDIPKDKLEPILVAWTKSNIFNRISVVNRLVDWVSDRPIGRALDIGCGLGHIPMFLQTSGYARQVVCIEHYAPMVKNARKLARKCGAKADIQHCNAGEQSFSELYHDHFQLVTCFDSICYPDTLYPILDQVIAVCAPGGLAVFSHGSNVDRNELILQYLLDSGRFRYYDGYGKLGERTTIAFEKIC